MSNITRAEPQKMRRRSAGLAVAVGFSMATTLIPVVSNAQEGPAMNSPQSRASSASETLTVRQQAIVPIAAFGAAGDIAKLNAALNRGLDSGLTVSEAKEILVQLYAYAGFPRSINALAELMKVLDARKQRGVHDVPGSDPSRAVPKGDALLTAGTANQTKLSGAPVRGALFEFAPAIDEYLKTHLFGDIFERDNCCRSLIPRSAPTHLRAITLG